jgi:hypothetical protein
MLLLNNKGAAVTAGTGTAGASPAAASASAEPKLCGSEPTRPAGFRYIGAIPAGAPGGSGLTTFRQVTGMRPTILPYFITFGDPWDPVPLCRIIQDGAMPLLQMNPRHNGIQQIIAGKDNSFLDQFAAHIKSVGEPVGLSLGHEMNGNWYSWGYTKLSPALFVKAWQVMVNRFAADGVTNAIWIWTVNVDRPPGVNPLPWWPGNKYVTWVGIDGHYTHPGDSFSTVFGGTITEVRSVTTKPILIAEMAIAPGPDRVSEIANLYSNVEHDPGINGFVWFDIPKNHFWTISPGSADAKEFQAENATFNRLYPS